LARFLALAIVIEVVEHEVEVWVYILSQVIKHSLLLIDRNPKRLVVIRDY
jgi:hypothetical protein